MNWLGEALRSSGLPPIVLQLVGLGAFVFFVAFWALTDRVEPALLAASGGLIATGQLASVRKSVRDDDEADTREG